MFIGILSVCTIGSSGESLVSNSKRPIKCLLLNIHLCQARPRLVDMNYDETLFYPFTVIVKKCGGSFNTTDNQYARVCVPSKVKIVNVRAFNLMPGVDWTRFLGQRESCECKCRLNEGVCNSKQNRLVMNVGASWMY